VPTSAKTEKGTLNGSNNVINVLLPVLPANNIITLGAQISKELLTQPASLFFYEGNE